MKTSEEIKKGLEHCEKEMCKKCPYEADCNMEDAFTGLSFDALALIQQLEAENAELKRELDAAVRVLRKTSGCLSCKHEAKTSDEQPCMSCGIAMKNYEWRGP